MAFLIHGWQLRGLQPWNKGPQWFSPSGLPSKCVKYSPHQKEHLVLQVYQFHSPSPSSSPLAFLTSRALSSSPCLLYTMTYFWLYQVLLFMLYECILIWTNLGWMKTNQKCYGFILIAWSPVEGRLLLSLYFSCLLACLFVYIPGA